MKQSTRTMIRKHGWRIDRAAHNYLYFKYYAPYTNAALIGTTFLVRYFSWFPPIGWAARFIFERYHSKVLSGQNAERVLTLNRTVDSGAEIGKRVVPYRYATRILFLEPQHLAVMDCPCKKSTKAPCGPLNSCIAVGKQLADYWLENCGHYNARPISQQEALDLVRELRKSGHVTQAFLKVATGGHTGVICNCCPDCCVSLQATRLARKIDPSLSMNAPSGYSVQRDESACQFCGACAERCPMQAILITDGRYEYDRSLCLGCELCVENCTHNALNLYVDPNKPQPLDLERMAGA